MILLSYLVSSAQSKYHVFRSQPRRCSGGVRVSVTYGSTPGLTEGGLFPVQFDREYEAQLLDLCASGDLDPQHWRRHGPAFFMAGLAVMLASVPEFDRRSLLDLAEALQAGSS